MKSAKQRLCCGLFLLAPYLCARHAAAQTTPEHAPEIRPSAEQPPSAATLPSTQAAAPTPSAAAPTAPADEPTQAIAASSPATAASLTPTTSPATAVESEPTANEPPEVQRPQDPAALLAELDAELGTPLIESESSPNLNLYGFADVGYYKYFFEPGSLLAARVYPKNAFFVGNLNVYLAGELGEGWRSLTEIRFTYLPNGSRLVGATGVQRTDTEVNDYTNLGRPRQTGSILIERAWLEYAATPLFTLRAGSWLTPYGVWNEDHGSPTVIPVSRPYVIGLELLPERQTGLLAYGAFYPSESVSLGYALGVSNGRGPVQDYADLDENKAITLRAHGSHHGAGILTFGASAYLGKYTNLNQVLEAEGERVVLREQLSEQYNELSWGIDARYLIHSWHLQAEFIMNEKAFTAEGRPLRLGSEFQPDNRSYGGYALLGYRFDWLGLMPYATAEYFRLINVWELQRPPTSDLITDYALGINSRPTNNVTLKVEGNVGIFYVENAVGSAFEHPVVAVQAQAAWVF